MADGLFGGAAFGFYPQLNRYRRGDPRDALNLPVDVTRGRLAGTMGTPTDIANFVRSPSPMEMFGDISYEPPAQLPYTTEHFLKELPMAPTSRLGQVAGQAASFAPMNPMPAVRGLQKVGGIVGEELAATLMGQRPGSMMSRVVPQPLFAVEPSLAQALGEAPTRQELLAKMQGLLGQKMGLSAGPELDAVNQEISALQQQFKQMPSVQRVSKEVVAPEITAPVSDIGFYSAAEQAGQGLARQSGTGESFLNDLMKAPDVKKDELSWMGLDDYLKGKPNVTKQEVQDFIAANKVDVKEVKLGGNEAPSQDLLNWMSARSIMPPRNPEGWQELSQKLESYAQQHQKAQGAPEASQRYFTLSEEAGRIAEGLDAGGSSAGATKYQKYQLPGGENYREILLTLPARMDTAGWSAQKSGSGWLVFDETGAQRGSNYTATTANNAIAEMAAERAGKSYKSSHFDEPNILAHMRVNDRIDAEGKKMLLIEEVQSDWHQAGREKGYRKEGSKQALEAESKAIGDERNRLVKELSEQEKKNGFVSIEGQQQWDVFKLKEDSFKQKYKDFSSQVPDAPFKDTWHQLALKRVLKYAADNGYERVGLTTGSQQAERYNLAKQVDEVIAKRNPDGSFNLDATLVNGGQQQSIGKNIPLDKLPDYVGKDLAKSMQAQEFGTDVYSGDALKVGGEGMKKYYDEIYPAFLDKQAKKWNSKTGETRIKTGQGIPGGAPVRYIDITPEMKGGLAKGQPLHGLAAIPALPLATVDYSDPFQDSIR